jgi:hypothetical protein
VRKARRRKEKSRFWQTFELGVSEYEAEILMLLPPDCEKRDVE